MGVIQTILKSMGLRNRNDQEIGEIGEPRDVERGNQVEVEYKGLLKNDGADRVFMHYAYDSWSHPARTIPMQREADGNFRAAVPAEGDREINFCFKDSADHWDNNSGWNWVLHLHK